MNFYWLHLYIWWELFLLLLSIVSPTSEFSKVVWILFSFPRRTLYFVRHQNYFKNSNQNACDINNSKLCWWYVCATDWCNKCRQNTILIRKDWVSFCFHFILSIGTQIDHICALNVHVCLNGISSIWIIDSILKWKKRTNKRKHSRIRSKRERTFNLRVLKTLTGSESTR